MAMTDNHMDDFQSFSYGKNFCVGHYNHIGKNVTLGENVTIGHHCIIGDNVKIGDNTKLENFIFLNDDTVIGNHVFVDSYVRSSGKNFIGNYVTIRYGATIAKGVEICDRVFISPNVMTIFSTHKGEAKGKTLICEKAFIGTAAVIGPGVTIGDEVVIGAMAFVSKDCLEKGKYVGVPAVRLKSGISD